MNLKTGAVQLVTVCLLASGAVVMPWATQAAQAATPTCTNSALHNSRTGSRRINVPVTSGGSENCKRGPNDSPSTNATKAIQAALVLCYGQDLGSSGPGHDGVDGIYGAKTVSAMKQAQTIIGVTSDGVYGPKSHNAMQFLFSANGEGGCALAKKV